MPTDDRPVSPLKPDEESATTREEMDFDDPTSPAHTGGRVSPITKPAKSPSPRPRVAFQDQDEEIPPSKPARPTDAMAQAEHTLIEAFPTIDVKVVKAVLMASGGRLEPAFNALLGMSDPDFRPEAQAPVQQPPRQQRQPRNQLEADEIYARQLAEEYDVQHGTRYNQRGPEYRGPNSQRHRYEEDDRERSFLDDDLPEIGRSIQQGFMETQKTVNTWIQNFKRRLDGDDEDDLYSAGSTTNQRQNFGPSQREQLYGIQRQEAPRRSVEQQRYDADHRPFSDEDFSRLELRDDEPPPSLPRRPPQSGSVDEVEHAERTDSKNRKWQALTSVAPHPEDDNDPFALGDDEEKEEKSEEVRKEDSARLKEAARLSISGESGDKAAAEATDKSAADKTDVEADKTAEKVDEESTDKADTKPTKDLKETKKKGTKNAEAEKILNKK